MIVLVQEKQEKQQGQYVNLEIKGINIKTQKETTQLIYSTLKDKWELIQPDKPIELVMQNKGTQDNPKWQVTDIKLVSISETEGKPPESQSPSVKTATQTKGYKAESSIERQESIERQVSLKTAVELAIAGKIDLDSIISFATVFDMYLSGDFVESESELITKYLAKYGRKGGK